MAGFRWQRTFALVVSALFLASVAAVGVAAPVAAADHTYKLTFKTANATNAGTNARIYVTLHGDLGYSETVMVKAGSSVPTWSVDSTKVVNVDDGAQPYGEPWHVGRIYEIKVYNDHHNAKAEWKCDWVSVKHMVDGVESSTPESLFRFEKWFDGKDGWTHTKRAEGFPWITGHGSTFVEHAMSEIEHKNLLASKVPSEFERQLSVSAGSEVGLAEGVTTSAELTARGSRPGRSSWPTWSWPRTGRPASWGRPLASVRAGTRAARRTSTRHPSSMGTRCPRASGPTTSARTCLGTCPSPPVAARAHSS